MPERKWKYHSADASDQGYFGILVFLGCWTRSNSTAVRAEFGKDRAIFLRQGERRKKAKLAMSNAEKRELESAKNRKT